MEKLTSKEDFMAKNIIRNKEGYFIKVSIVIYQEDVKF